ncbi:ras-like GTP-binding protein RHO [Oppia nitens]|uniref:ras-like GTP-binding protein RHO n=1 Tax=Oppia nitens TaxID=1686743 RepID=UPI0023DB13DD|nr:ras-like GTP-binding protein RHO [Oppia nitens]
MFFKQITRKKLVIIGDGEVGKTCLLLVFSKDHFPTEYIPTVFEASVVNFYYKNKQVALELWDTAGQEDFDRLRPLSYPDSDVLLLCFSVVSPDSLANIYEKWMPEVTHHCAGVPMILVGTKSDLRSDKETVDSLERQKQTPVSFGDGCRAAQDIGAYGYCECSSRNNEGILPLFEMAVASTESVRKFPKPGQQKGVCNVL